MCGINGAVAMFDRAGRPLEGGVPTAVFYPQPLHEAPAYQSHSVVPGGVAVAERISGRVVSLPMHPHLGEAEQARVNSALRKALTPE